MCNVVIKKVHVRYLDLLMSFLYFYILHVFPEIIGVIISLSAGADREIVARQSHHIPPPSPPTGGGCSKGERPQWY